MGVFHVAATASFPPVCQQGAVAIGNFDGVHRGHAALVAELRNQAESAGGPAVVVTFDPHPLEVLRPEQFQPVLTTPADRAELLQAIGADHVLILQTTHELLALTPREFFDRVIRDQLCARALVEGPNFTFGRDRAGNAEVLRGFATEAGIPLTIPPFFALAGRPVSSSRVRAALQAGDVRQAAELLGRPYRVRGVVRAGQRRGQTLGFPTANLHDIPTLIPGDGVYAARASLGGKIWPSAVNIGPNPTFAERERKVEAHIIGRQGDLYGETLAVGFLERLRDTRPFAGKEELVQQLRNDVEQARRIAEGRK